MNVREGMLVFCSTEVFFVSYPALPYVYGAEKISAAGVASLLVAAFDCGRAMWVSHRGIQIYSAGQVQTIALPDLQ